MKFCSECGERLPSPAGRFCSACGHRLVVGDRVDSGNDQYISGMDVLVGKGWSAMEAGAAEQAEALFAQALEYGWPGGPMGLAALYEMQGRLPEALEAAERAFTLADDSVSDEQAIHFRTGAALKSAEITAQLLRNESATSIGRLEQEPSAPTVDVGGQTGSLRERFALYIKFLVSTDGIDAEMALLGAELGAKMFKVMGASAQGGPNYGRMLECLAFLAQFGDADQKRQAIEEVNWWFDRWGRDLPISVMTYEPVQWVIAELRPGDN